MRGIDPVAVARGLVWPLRTLVFGGLLFTLFAQFGIGETRIALFGRLVGLLAVVGSGWLAHRIVTAVGNHLVVRAAGPSRRLDEIVTALGVGLLKVVVIIITVVAAADAVGLPYEGVLTGLGIGGLALAFAARETVSNMLAAAILLVDRPFRRGDLNEVGGAMATLEAVGLRSTRLRTFDDSVMIVPNSQLSDQAIVNWGERRQRKVTLAIGLTYDTPRDRLDAFVADLRDVFAAQPCAADGICHIGLSGFGDSSININLWGYFAVDDYEAQVRAQHRLVADVVDLARRLDVSFAFPTRAIQIEQVPPQFTTCIV